MGGVTTHAGAATLLKLSTGAVKVNEVPQWAQSLQWKGGTEGPEHAEEAVPWKRS